MKSTANDIQVGGGHYRATYQHWDMVADVLEGRYLEGQVTKYISRWRKKNGLEDLRKAGHYTSKLWESAQVGKSTPMRGSSPLKNWRHALLDNFFNANPDLDGIDREIFMRISHWQCLADIEVIMQLITRQTELASAAEPGRQYVDQG